MIKPNLRSFQKMREYLSVHGNPVTIEEMLDFWEYCTQEECREFGMPFKTANTEKILEGCKATLSTIDEWAG